MTTAAYCRRSGWAGSVWACRERLAYHPAGDTDPEPAYAVADAWAPPHPLSLPAELCARIRGLADGLVPFQRGTGDYFDVDLPPDITEAVVSRLELANAAWWQLGIDEWAFSVKRYRAGDRHPEHQDLAPGYARRKLAGSVQLSDPAAYDGGALVVRFAHHRRIEMPRQQGTLIAFPAWAVHEVEPITRGERWMLHLNSFGPALR